MISTYWYILYHVGIGPSIGHISLDLYIWGYWIDWSWYGLVNYVLVLGVGWYL